ncbi:7TM domain-containing protein [Pseudofulvibacter geojedonensis]|uniref:7TM domain-containing protein n=1 Tax=Pseudofulvibacter geojedonensis TaxID=1123758 RepID=A0ABW3I312_9FLAO
MRKLNSYSVTLVLLIVVALISMSFKFKPVIKSYDDFLPQKVYSVTYDFYIKSKKGKKIFVKSFLPIDNDRQKIEKIVNKSKGMSFEIKKDENGNDRGIWRKKKKKKAFNTISYSFLFKGKAIKYNIADDLPVENIYYTDSKYLAPEKYMQVNNPKITKLVDSLSKGKTDLKSLLKSYYDFVNNIPSAPIRDLTDAVTALEQNQASCNGKSRLLVTICRNKGIPARLVGGVILESIKKRTSHLWTEIFIKDKWVPFDVLNGYFAYLPANYIELYRGDKFLVTHTPNVLFDYKYDIKEINHIPYVNVTGNEAIMNHPISFWRLSKEGVMSDNVLYFFLLLPVGGLIVALFKNVIGLKTYGVFLSVLIAFTLTNTGYFTGMLLFLLMIFIVTLMSIPLNKWGLLYTPKVVVILTSVIFIILSLINIGIAYEVEWLVALTFFPIIIVSIMAERFSRAIIEEGHKNALKTMLQTLVVTSFCYLVFSSVIIKTVLLIFPEIILIILAVNLMLGKWIGLRLTEYRRFKYILD